MSDADLHEFHNAVRERDGWRCRMCGRIDAPLAVHMITEPYWFVGYVMENAITLCDPSDCQGCFRLAEAGITFIAGGLGTEGYREKDMYARIGSSFIIAARATEALQRATETLESGLS